MRKFREGLMFTFFCAFVGALVLLFVVGIALVQFVDQEPQRHQVNR